MNNVPKDKGFRPARVIKHLPHALNSRAAWLNKYPQMNRVYEEIIQTRVMVSTYSLIGIFHSEEFPMPTEKIDRLKEIIINLRKARRDFHKDHALRQWVKENLAT